MKAKVLRLALHCNLKLTYTLHHYFRNRYLHAIHLCAVHGHANLV